MKNKLGLGATAIVFSIITLVATFFFFVLVPVRATTLDSLPVGTAIQITGQSGAIYKFIKLIPRDDDGNVMTHSNGSAGSYWMLADNYCGLAGRPSNCVNNTSGAASTSYNFWNPTSDGTRYNNWTTMASTQYGVYRQVLTPFYNDLPPNIAGMAKDSAILTKAYPMSSITATSGTGTTTKSSCYLTAGSAGTGTANTSDCTWTDKISLPSYTDWQNGLNAYGYYASAGSNAYAYSMTRFGTAWDSSNKFDAWWPWLRSPNASGTGVVWRVNGVSSSASVNTNGASSSSGVSPTLWLSSNISTSGGVGTYAEPYSIKHYCDDPANQNKLDCLDTGTAIQITGQGGAEYKFIKLKPMDDDGNVMNHSDGANGSYWMLADNYCGLAGRQSNCVNNVDGTTSTNYQMWNPTSDETSSYTNWTTMASTQYSVYQQVLTPMLNDLPTTIGGLPKNSAILTKAYPMASIRFIPSQGATAKLICLLTAGSAGTGTADPTACTWTDKISLPSYTDWQDGLNGAKYYAPAGSNAYAYSMTRFGVAWDNSNMFDAWWPWLRSTPSGFSDLVYDVNGNHLLNPVDTNSININNAYSSSNGVSPTLWLSSEIILDGTGTGTYANPYNLNSALSQNYVSLSAPVASWDGGSRVLNVTGLVGCQVGGQSVLVWAAACNTAGQCKQKSTTVIIGGDGFQAYNLDWQAAEMPAGEYDGTIWVGAHVMASPSDEANAFNQSNPVTFTISPRTLDFSVTKNRAFNLNLGDAAIFNLTPGTNQGVTVAIDSATNDLLISGTLTQDTQIAFGSTILNFQTYEIPQSVVINDSLSLQ